MSNRFFLLLSFCLFFLVACVTDPCENRNCGKGTCNEVSGDCICLRGYRWDDEGQCTVPWSTQYEGNYRVYDSCVGANAGVQIYTSQLVAQDTTTVLWTNFGNTGGNLPINHTSSTVLMIDWHSNDTLITGNSLIRNEVLSINYILRDATNNRNDTCYTVFTPE